MTALLQQYLTEIIVGATLAVFGFAARSWASRLTDSITALRVNVDKVGSRLERLLVDFHAHQIDDARMWSRIDADLKNVYKRLDRQEKVLDGNHQ